MKNLLNALVSWALKAMASTYQGSMVAQPVETDCPVAFRRYSGRY